MEKWIDLDGKCFLFCHNGKMRSQLAITSHGMQMPVRLFKSGYGRFKVPDWTTLYFYGPDGFSLVDPGISVVMRNKAPVYSKVGAGQYSNDYLLSKYSKDDYGQLAYSVAHETTRTDVLSIRARFGIELLPAIKLSQVLHLLDKKNRRYPHIHCVFCRTSLSGLIHSSSWVID